MEVGNVQQITAAQFGSRFKSKKEVFGFLTVELKAYLPSYHTVSIYFLKGKCLLLTLTTCVDIISGKKKYIHCSKIQYLYIPQYDNCSIKAILQQAANYPEVEQYLPDAKEHPQLPRQWLINVIFTIGGEDFGRWSQRMQDDRNNKMASDNNLLIDIDPEIKRVLDNSKFISSK